MSSPWVRVKWRITQRWFDRPDWCWCRAVNWALGYDSLRETIDNASGVEGCRREAATLGYCYCARFACRERLVEIGADPSGLNPVEWVPPADHGDGK